MKNRFILVALAVSVAAVSHAADPFTNGGFETNNVNLGNYLYSTDVPSAPNGVIANGWDFAGGTGISRNSGAWTSMTAFDGDSYAFVQGGDGSVLSQSFDVTSGQTYRVSFASLTRVYQNSAGLMDFSVDNVYKGTTTVNTSQWLGNTFTFTASGPSATLRFTGASTGDNSVFVDGVTVQAVPEPFTMGLGLAAAGLAVRRRLRKSAK